MNDDARREIVKQETSGVKEVMTGTPFYLHPSDNPSSLITPVILTGENYAEWATEMENALRAKRKFCFVDGSQVKPEEDSDELEQWKTVNSMIVGWIGAAIAPRIRSTVTFTTVAYKLWCDLKKRFSIGNAVRVHPIKFELASCRQGGLTVMNYFGKLSSMWEELLNYKFVPQCSCSAKEKYLQKYEEKCVHQFLMGLDEVRFGNVCTNIIGMKPLPDLNNAYQRVVREERRLNSSHTEQQQNIVGFTAKTESTIGGVGLDGSSSAMVVVA